jgi:hypothetical protein
MEFRGIVEDLNLKEFAVITGGLVLSEYLEKPMTSWGLDSDTKQLARVLGGEVVAYAMNALAPAEVGKEETKKLIKLLSLIPTTVAADGAKRYIAPKIGIAGAPQQVVIRQMPAPTKVAPSPAPMPAPASTARPAVTVGRELSDEELRNLGFLR